MQIVIDIPEEIYEEIKTKFLNTKVNQISVTDRAIFTGIPLPKSHGKLIDADEVKEMFHDKEGDDLTAFHFYDAIEASSTIVEADNTPITNGDKIKSLFPNIDYIEEKDNASNAKNILIWEDWWNAPYKGES